MSKIILKIKGMHCASCASTITHRLNKQEGIKTADISLATEKAIIEYEGNKIDILKIKEVIRSTGYEVDESLGKEDHSHEHSVDEKKQKRNMIFAIILTLPILMRMFWAWEVPGKFLGVELTHWIEHWLSFVVVFYFGWQFHANTFKQLKIFQVGMDALVSMGTLAAYFYSLWTMFAGGHLYFESAASIATLILLGRYLEYKTKAKASSAMKKLMELGVKKALIIENEKETYKNIEDIKIGDILLVKPSEKIALDGIVVGGESSVVESMLTGESMPIHKKKDSQVFGSTINKTGVLKIKVTQDARNTVLSKIIESVEEAQRTKPPMQKLADKISSIFVPTVIVIAILTFFGWFIKTGDIAISLINAVSVLIISCPCALGIATPIAVMVGASVGVQNSILIKSGDSFEKAKNIDVIVFDKTGTLTKGEPKISKVISNPEYDMSEEKIIKIANLVAKNSEHPLSRAVVNIAKEKKITSEEACDFKEIPGQGIVGKCESKKHEIFLGNIKLLKNQKISSTWAEVLMDEFQNSGETILYLIHEDKLVGAFLISDELRDNAQKTIDELKKMNLEPIMLSGDNKKAAESIAEKLGIKNYRAEVLPHEKQEEIKKLQNSGKRVIFVGDGINDAPSLVQADLGIALGSGTDIAKESGDVILMQNDLYKVVEAIKLSRKTFRIIKQNLFWAFFYNVIAIPLAVMGMVNPMIGAVAMSLSDVTVIGNGLRIYRK